MKGMNVCYGTVPKWTEAIPPIEAISILQRNGGRYKEMVQRVFQMLFVVGAQIANAITKTFLDERTVRTRWVTPG